MCIRIIGRVAATTLLAAAVGCGGGAGGNAKPPDKVITKDDAMKQINDDLQRNLESVDKDPNRTPKQKEDDKAMMKENVRKRLEDMKKAEQQ